MRWIKMLSFFIMCWFVLPCFGQSDTVQQGWLSHKMDSVRVDSTLYHLSKDHDFNTATSNPVWYLITAIAPVFNVGIGYSYVLPLNSFSKEVRSSSAINFDVGINLTRIFSNPDANWHLYVGFAASFTSFGKSGVFNSSKGDTSYETYITNDMEVLSSYLELEYNKGAFNPFISSGYSKIYLNPGRSTVMRIRNAYTNYTENMGESLANLSSNGINLGIGLKYKYRFKESRTIMLCLKSEVVYGASTEMADLKTVSFNSKGEASFQRKTVYPTWSQNSILLKYNF